MDKCIGEGDGGVMLSCPMRTGQRGTELTANYDYGTAKNEFLAVPMARIAPSRQSLRRQWISFPLSASPKVRLWQDSTPPPGSRNYNRKRNIFQKLAEYRRRTDRGILCDVSEMWRGDSGDGSPLASIVVHELIGTPIEPS